VDFAEWLPVEYRHHAVAVQRLEGLDRAAADGSRRAWLVFVQERTPEASLVLVLDQNFTPVWHGSSIVAGTDAATWFADADGRLMIGGLSVNPPTAGGTWSTGTIPGILDAGGDVPWLAVRPDSATAGRNYPIRLRVDAAGVIGPAGALYLASPGAWTMESADAGWTALSSLPAVLLRADFLSANAAALFPSGSVAANPGGAYPAVEAVCRHAAPLPGQGRIDLFCQAFPAGRPDQASRQFVVSLPWKALEGIDPSIDAVGLAILQDGAAPSGASGLAGCTPSWATVPDGTWLRSLDAYSSLGNDWLPLIRNGSDGSLSRRLDIRLPAYATSGSRALPIRGSSIGQQPYLFDGAGWWLAVDGFTRRLYVCAPWWQ
jgi:hypothetical protein